MVRFRTLRLCLIAEGRTFFDQPEQHLSEKPTTQGTLGSPSPRRWWRVLLFVLGIIALLVGLVLGGAYAWTSVVLSRAHENLGPDVYKALGTTTTTIGARTTTSGTAPPPPEGTLNILVLGSDRRPDDTERYGRSDTIMIVHVDPGTGFVSILSLPRDLRVRVPGHGLQKINAAYALGGDALAIETVRAVTGLDIDEYVNVDFEAFRRITTALGGIYVDVDHRYYSRNPNYEYVDVLPGYQRLQGDQALQYVRFRHDRNGDFGRISRQQGFLRAVREQAMGWSALIKLPQVAGLISENTATTMSANDVFRLAYWGVKLRSGNVKQAPLTGLRDAHIGSLDYLLADEASIQKAVADLLAPPEPSSPRGSETTSTSSTAGATSSAPGGAPSTTTAPSVIPGFAAAEPPDLRTITVEVLNANGRSGEVAAAARYLDGLGARIRSVGEAPDGPLAASVVVYPAEQTVEAARVSEALGVFKSVEDNARRRVTVFLGADYVAPEQSTPQADSAPMPKPVVWNYLGRAASFPLMAPSLLPDGFRYAGFRLYALESGDGQADTVKVMYRFGEQDQYVGLTETRFTDAPAASEGETTEEGVLTFTLVGNADSVDRIWWTKDGVLYWLSNTLSFQLDREEMLQFARSMVPVGE